MHSEMRTIFTTTDMREDKSKPEDELAKFKDIKKLLMKQKALIIKQAIEDKKENTTMIERI